MSISVLNTDAGLSGKTIANLEDAQNVTGLKSFNRSPNAPFAVQAASAVVPNLIAESLSGGSVAATTGTFSSTLAVTGLITGRDVTIVTSTTTGATNNWAPGIAVGTTLIEASGAALAATGLDGGSSGCVVIIKNTGSGVLTFAHDSASSDADNQLQNMVTSAATPVAAGGYIMYIHDGTDWKMIAHEQGAWIVPTFADSNYTGAGTDADWAVAAGDVSTQSYYLSGKMLSVNFYIITTTVQNTPASLRITNGAWGSFTPTRLMLNPCFGSDAGSDQMCYATVLASGTEIRIHQVDSGSWGNATNTTNVFGSISFEVT